LQHPAEADPTLAEMNECWANSFVRPGHNV
jgi:hypothetical protein